MLLRPICIINKTGKKDIYIYESDKYSKHVLPAEAEGTETALQ